MLRALIIAACVCLAQEASAQHLGFVVGATAPPNAESGDVWSDTTSNTLKKFNGATWDVVGGGGAAWGGITGTLANQTDLQTALDGKQVAGSYLAPSGNGGSLTGLTKAQVGLSNADNTSDANKPISTLQQTAFDNRLLTNANAVSATVLLNARTINGVSFNGSANITVPAAGSTLTDNVTYARGGIGACAATSATTGAMTVTMTAPCHTITPTGAATFNASGGVAGQIATFAITTSGTSSFVLTFGTNFRKTGTLATGTVSARFFAVTFLCLDGTIWMEIARTAVQT